MNVNTTDATIGATALACEPFWSLCLANLKSGLRMTLQTVRKPTLPHSISHLNRFLCKFHGVEVTKQHVGAMGLYTQEARALAKALVHVYMWTQSPLEGTLEGSSSGARFRRAGLEEGHNWS